MGKIQKEFIVDVNDNYSNEFLDLFYNQETTSFCISARILHKKLKISGKFTDWLSRRIKTYGLEENIDYKIVKRKQSIGKSKGYANIIEYILTITTALELCSKETKCDNVTRIYEYLTNFCNNKIHFLKHQRDEIDFKEMLYKVTNVDWESQYPIDNGKYRLDFYLKNILIVEYDEEYHNYQQEDDENRMQYCREWLRDFDCLNDWDDWLCPYIRVQKGKELEGLNKIMMHLISFDVYEDAYKNKYAIS